MRRQYLRDEHLAYAVLERTFVDREIRPDYLDWESAGIVPRELFAAAGRAGLLGIDIPEPYGGAGISDFRFNHMLGEELMLAGIGGAGTGLTLHNDVCQPYFLEYGTDEQRGRRLPGIAAGTLITAVAMSEPAAGSDLAGIRTTAVRDGDDLVVNGGKTFITNGVNADLVITAVRTGPERHRGLTLVVLERGMPGFERGRRLEKLGMHSQKTAELFFQGRTQFGCALA